MKDIFQQTVSQLCGVEIEKEYKFHDKRRWRFDYAIPEHKIAIEVEGGVWNYGRHNRASGFLADMEKYNTAAVMGWRLLRVTPEEMMKRKTIDMIREAMNARLKIDETK